MTTESLWDTVRLFFSFILRNEEGVRNESQNINIRL